MTPNFTEVNEVTSQHLAAVTAEQEGKTKFITKGYEDCPLEIEGTLKRAVDVYHGPEGDGYVIRFLYEMKGQRWCRREAYGPQSFRSHDWIKIPMF